MHRLQVIQQCLINLGFDSPPFNWNRFRLFDMYPKIWKRPPNSGQSLGDRPPTPTPFQLAWFLGTWYAPQNQLDPESWGLNHLQIRRGWIEPPLPPCVCQVESRSMVPRLGICVPLGEAPSPVPKVRILVPQGKSPIWGVT